MKLHLPVGLRASLIAAVVAVASGVYNAHANDITGTNIPFTEVYNHTSGNTYTATNNITFQATQQTQGVFASFISGDTTLTAGNAVVFANHFGANTTDLVPSQEKKYDGKLNIVADNIQVAQGGNRVVLEDAKVGKKTAATGEVSVGSLSELVVLNGDLSTLSDAERKTLHAEGLVNTPTCEQRPSTEQAVVMGALTGAGNFAVYGDEDDTDSVRVVSIGTPGTAFGNISAANETLAVTGAVNANTLVAVRSDVTVGQAVTLVGLDLDVDSTLTAAGDIDAGDATGHVAVYGAVESTGGNVHLIHGNKSDKDGLHEGSSVKAAQKATIEDLNAVLAEVEGTHGVDILNGSVVEGSTITAGDNGYNASVTIDNSTLQEHVDATSGTATKNVVNATLDVTIKNGASVTGTEINAARDVVVTGAKSKLTGNVDVNAERNIVVEDNATLSIDGGKGSDATVDAAGLVVRKPANGTASIANADIDLEKALISDEQTLQLKHVTGGIGAVVEANDGAPEVKGASIVVDEASVLDIGSFSSEDNADASKPAHYFGNAEIKGGSSVVVSAASYIDKYKESGNGTNTTFLNEVSIIDASISGDATTLAKAGAHVGTMHLQEGGTLTVGTPGKATQSYISSIDATSEGTLNVIGGTLTTPALSDDKLNLGLHGATVVLAEVAAADGATVASAAHSLNPHVLLDSITNPGVMGAPAKDSTIITQLGRYDYTPGEEKTADIYTYYYVARVDGQLDDGTLVTAGQLVTRTDEVFTTTLHTGDVVNSGVDLTSAATLSEHDGLILDRLTQPMLDKYGDLIHVDDNTRLVAGQVCEKVDEVTYYDGVSDSVTPVNDGIASLTLAGDLSASKVHINAYKVANLVSEPGATPEVYAEDMASGYIAIEGDISGSDNVLFADRDMTIGSMTGQNSVLTARGDITIGDIGTEGAASSHHEITATNVTTGDIYSSSGAITADENIETGNITGDANELAAADILTGNITGDENILKADNIETADITGNSNELAATEDIQTGAITGDSNELTAGGSIATGVVTGDDNTLTAQGSVTAAGVAGNENLLTSETDSVEVTGDVQGDANALLAETDVVIGGSVKGDGNLLAANTGYIAVDGDIVGDDNILAAEDLVYVGGDLDGDGNSLTSVNGDFVSVEGTVSGEGNVLSAQSGDVNIGAIDGTDTVATAQKTAWVGSLSGTGTDLTVYANGLSKDDTAIIIGEFNAQDTTVTIATTSSEVYGETCGNGSIYIGALTTTDGTVDPSMGNLIVSNNSYVEIGAMAGADAYTDIVARDYIAIGDEEGTQADSACHLTLTASVLYVDSAEGVELTDSKITVSGNIEGTSLTLTTTEDGKSISSAASVVLENLTLGGNAMLTAAEAAISDTLTIDGKLATLDVTKVDASTLVLRHNADISAARVGAENLVVEESTFAFTSIDGIQSLKIDHSKGQIKQALDSLTGDVEIVNGSELYMTDDLGTTAAITVADSTVEVSNITAGDGLNAENSTVTAKNTIDIQGGESDISNSVVAAKKVNVDGIVNAGEKALIMGHITGDGSINKTGGDALVIADADSSVDINVQDASTLKLADGTKVGAVDMGTEAAVLQLGEAGHVDTVEMESLTLSAATGLTLDMDLDRATVDKADAAIAALNGVSIKLNAMGDEGKVADQTRIAFVSGSVTTGAAEDVQHGMRTLNAYADGNSIVLSKNFRSVEGLSHNQRNAAGALADLEDHMEVSGDMAEVMDALHHTRNAEDTRAALDSLGGVGLAAVAKMATDDAHDHLQALRGNLKALAAGLDYRYDEQGHRVPGVQSSAISASVTGGTTNVQGGVAPKYSRDSIGALVSGVHAITHEWAGGISLGYNHSKGDCGPVDLKSDAIYVDVAMIRRGPRVTHTATLGLGSYDFDTTRHAQVAAKGHDYAGTAKGSTSAMLVNLSYEAVATVLGNEKHNLSGVFLADLVFGELRGLTETGMGNAGLRSEYDDVASLNFGIGGRYTYSFGRKTNPGYLAVEAMLVADAGDRDAVVKNTFIAGGQTFEQKGPDAGACGFRVNGGALIPVGQRWGVFGNVSSEFRSHQTSVSGSVGVKYAF